jgi:hypothetical protein
VFVAGAAATVLNAMLDAFVGGVIRSSGGERSARRTTFSEPSFAEWCGRHPKLVVLATLAAPTAAAESAPIAVARAGGSVELVPPT